MEAETDPNTNPLFEMHRQLTDAQRGLITFEMLRKTWVAWAKLQLGLEDQEKGVHSHTDPSNPDSEPKNVEPTT